MRVKSRQKCVYIWIFTSIEGSLTNTPTAEDTSQYITDKVVLNLAGLLWMYHLHLLRLHHYCTCWLSIPRGTIPWNTCPHLWWVCTLRNGLDKRQLSAHSDVIFSCTTDTIKATTGGSVNLIFTKLKNLVSLLQSHHKPVVIYCHHTFT